MDEPNLDTTIWTFIGLFVILFAQERLMGVFYEKRRTSFLVMVILYLAAAASLVFFLFTYSIVSPIAPGWQEPPLLWSMRFLMSMIVPPFIISLNYNSLLVKRLVVAFCSAFIALAAGAFLEPVFFFVYTVGSIDLIPFLELVLGFLICLVVLLLRCFKHIRKDSINLTRFWIPALILPTIIMSWSVFDPLGFADAYVMEYIYLLYTAVLLLSSVFIMCSLYNVMSGAYEFKLKSELQTQEKEYYFTQCQLMQESVEKMKSYRHDVKLHLHTLKNLTEGNKAATNYLDTLLDGIGESEVYSDTGNIAFDSIINFKLRDVVEEGIKLQLKIAIPMIINIDVVDVVTILGNLLDNAFDAVAKVDDKMISLTIEANQGSLLINIDNSFDGEVIYSEGRGREIISRKEGEHGYGLRNIRKSVEKYNGHMDISHEGDIFSVGILLYIDATKGISCNLN